MILKSCLLFCRKGENPVPHRMRILKNWGLTKNLFREPLFVLLHPLHNIKKEGFERSPLL